MWRCGGDLRERRARSDGDQSHRKAVSVVQRNETKLLNGFRVENASP